ncbi:hypothetical protein C8J56DRAFT_834383 [Mycena floridula]|nr:hypothetical protein C8J56DRAFT_834383 [Mycena floridula]
MADYGLLNHGLKIKTTVAIYNQSQIIQWLSVIGYTELEPRLRHDDLMNFPRDLETLTILQRLHITTFLYENTQMHYTPEHCLDVSPSALFQRMVIERKGSWCFGQNSLFLGMIQSLGFRAYSGGARVNTTMDSTKPPVYTQLGHMILFVQPSAESNLTYLVDAGFGGSGPARPILLSDASDNIVMGSTPTELHRLTRGTRADSSLEVLPDTSKPSNVEWRLEVRHEKPNSRVPGDHSDLIMATPTWRVLYAFSEHEFFRTDIESASFTASMTPRGIFYDNVVCLRSFWLNREEILAAGGADNDGSPVPVSKRFIGRLSLEGRRIRRHIGSQTEDVEVVCTEEQRLEALEAKFSLCIPRSAVDFIKGRNAAI